MSDEDPMWITGGLPRWSLEEDLKWCANLALIAGALLALAGFVSSHFIVSAAWSCYVIAGSILIGTIFCGVGVATHWHVRHHAKRTTIKRIEHGRYLR